MNQAQPSISPDHIDDEVRKVISQHPGITKASVYYLLEHLPQTLVYSSLKRLEVREEIGYSLVHSPIHSPSHSPIQENKTEDNHSPRQENRTEEIHSPRQENKGLHVRWRPSAGTASGGYLYPYLYLDDKCLIYIGGGNKSNPVALKRVEEIEHLIRKEVITPSMDDFSVRHLVKGVIHRNPKS